MSSYFSRKALLCHNTRVSGIFRQQIAIVATFLVLTIFWSKPALAQQVKTEISGLIKDASTWFQGIAMSWGVFSVIRAGMSFMDPEESQQAPFRLKRAIVGLIVIFGAVGIVQFVKSRFTTQTW